MNKGKLAIIFTISLFLSIGIVSAAQYEVNETNYGDYFDDDGSLKSNVVDDDTLVFNGEISNKNFKIDKKLNLEGKNTTKIINGTFNFYGSSSGSVINGITIMNTDKNGIYLTDNVSNLKIANNHIHLIGTSGTTNLYGIVAYGTTTNNNISNNLINITGGADYNYGILITSYGENWATGNENPENYIIYANTIIANVEKYIAAIQTDSVLNLNISKNKINLISKNLAYGIVVQDMYMADYMILEPIGGINVIDNTITAKAKITYLIQLYMVGAYTNSQVNTISNNVLYGEGTSVYGIAAYVSKYLNITKNNITTIGGDYSSISDTGDAIPSGINPIVLYGAQYMGYCDHVNITDNKFETNNAIIIGKPLNETFAPRNVQYSNNSQTFIIDDDTYSYFYNEYGEFLPGVNVTANDTVKLGTLSRKKLIIDRKLNIMAYNSSSKFLFSQLIIRGDDASGTIVKGLYALSDSSIFFIENSNNNLLENNYMSIISNVLNDYENIVGISIVYDSSGNTIKNNVIDIKGSSNGGYYYGISIMNGNYPNYALNPMNNIISGNNISIDSNNYANAIYLSMAINTSVFNNNINIKSKSFAYGVVVEYNPWAYVNNVQITSDNKIYNNKIQAKGGMVYLIRSDLAENNTFRNNSLYGEGDAVYAYAGTGSKNDIIDSNNITVIGNDVSKIPFNYDTAGSGHGGIYANGSSSLKITNNNIVSTYKKGGDYAIKLVESNGTNTISNNKLNSDNGKKVGTAAIFKNTNNTVEGNKPLKTIITIHTKKIIQGNKAIVKVLLKDENGKILSNQEIILTIKGKTYKATTNNKGIASFTISGLGGGNNPVKAEFKGMDNLAKSSVLGTQKVTPKPIFKAKKQKAVIGRNGKIKVLAANIGSKIGSKIYKIKLPKSHKYIGTKLNFGSYKYNKSTRTLTWKLPNLKVYKKATDIAKIAIYVRK